MDNENLSIEETAEISGLSAETPHAPTENAADGSVAAETEVSEKKEKPLKPIGDRIRRCFSKKENDTEGPKSKATKILLLIPYFLAFAIFIILPVLLAIGLSFTDFDGISSPSFVGLKNYITLFTNDDVFMQYVIPNTLLFAVIAGPVGYILSFFMAWLLAQIPKAPRTVLALCIYAPSLTSGVAIQVVWVSIFSGDPNGYLNAILLDLGIISEAVQWLQSGEYLMAIMILVTIWSSCGVGFLSMLSGILNIDPELYEAAYMDGMKNRFQEIIHVTIPSIKPQLMFGAVMAIVNTFQAGSIGVALSGSNPTPNYNGQLIINHIEDYAYIRYEMGYASAISVVLLLFMYLLSKIIGRLFKEKD